MKCIFTVFVRLAGKNNDVMLHSRVCFRILSPAVSGKLNAASLQPSG